ncbi:MAG: ParB/RepB/Spo0J family partition protein [Candidatus Bathyarchaeia archaeon]|jgi:ParB/RepB/Spo0J family partition protein
MSKSSGKKFGLKYGSELDYLGIADIDFNNDNPREERGKLEVEDLKESIREIGVLVPIVVFRKSGTTRYLLLEGERRLRACQQLYEETKDSRFAIIPANILDAPPNKLAVLVSMFHMHSNRKKWRKNAEAEALASIKELDPKGTSNTSKIVDLTGLKPITVEEELTYLRFPKDLRDLVRTDQIGQYNLILLGRNLKALQTSLPGSFEKHDWNTTARALIEKVLSGTIIRARDFNVLTGLAKECIRNENEQVFIHAFDRLVKDPEFSLEDMQNLVERETRQKDPNLFKSFCEEFLSTLREYVKPRKFNVENEIHKVLKEIEGLIDSTKPA